MKSFSEMAQESEQAEAAFKATEAFARLLVRGAGETLTAWRQRADDAVRAANIGVLAWQVRGEIADAIMRDPEAKAQAEREAREKEALKASICDSEWRARAAAHLPKRVAQLAFAGDETPAVRAVHDWLASKTDRSLVLRGGVGAGKSTAAGMFVKKLLEPTIHQVWDLEMDRPRQLEPMRLRVGARHWVRPDELVSAVLHDYDENSPRLASEFVLDDMGRETKSDFTEALCSVLDGGKHRMVITTNLTKQQMRERYDLRLLDRMNECCVAFDVPGKSLRDQGGNF